MCIFVGFTQHYISNIMLDCGRIMKCKINGVKNLCHLYLKDKDNPGSMTATVLIMRGVIRGTLRTLRFYSFVLNHKDLLLFRKKESLTKTRQINETRKPLTNCGGA